MKNILVQEDMIMTQAHTAAGALNALFTLAKRNPNLFKDCMEEWLPQLRYGVGALEREMKK